MNGKNLLDGMNHIDDKFIEEADEMKREKVKITPMKKWLAAAACFVFIAAAAAVIPQITNLGNDLPAESGAPSGNVTEEESERVIKKVTVNMNKVFVNELEEAPVAKAFPKWWLEECERKELTYDEVKAYYGRDIMPEYVPEGLTPGEHNGRAGFYVKKDGGTIVYDTVTLGYYGEALPDGVTKKGFEVRMAKIGFIRDYSYDTDEVKTSEILGIQVKIGRCSMPYGPYDPVTHKPSGSYDMYIAEFTAKDGTKCEIEFTEMPLEECVKVIASVISGAGNIEVAE